MNQQRLPLGLSYSRVGCLLVLCLGVLVCVGSSALLALLLSLQQLNANIFPASFNSLILLAAIACTAWLVRYWLRLIRQAEAIEAQRHYDTYIAQQRYQAYGAWQQAKADQHDQQARQAYMERIHALDSLLNLTPAEFDQAICLLFEFWGYPEVLHVGGVSLAVDIICRDKAGEVTAVQCKRYEPDMPVGNAEIQKFIDVTEGRHFRHRVFVTTSSYSESAVDLGHKYDFRLIDGAELARHIQEFRAAVEE